MKTTVGLIIGNRGFFPSKLWEESPKVLLRVLKEEDTGVVTPEATAAPYGSVEKLHSRPGLRRAVQAASGGDQRHHRQPAELRGRACRGRHDRDKAVLFHRNNLPQDTFGGYGAVRVPESQRLPRYIFENGIEHHVAVSPTLVADAVQEAFGRYLGWEMYRHLDWPVVHRETEAPSLPSSGIDKQRE